ncbi:MAG: decarboxylating 6-phosphogluconate dehydrogenase [Ignavibacteriota bacterium]|nr:MAG: decarboxylating 6-phosphogluconate dehydrogenase [Chlorobiota bacterium]MBE7476325.1 decarboxylating 6-phosphogluconate dehydrogenase [Ignavibacteriales bacterium]MBL1124193.1 decarboxylating 6-phosphogluconate dehydrogenase [Ignavibacteriota bacterium]MCE7858031.1 decarboxylating 6-phosphogluconate dehydrogenase [Ignavibacteria bacterium CHB3]QKJ96328.1 MAG: decarboxylating 6-phosphogluconate dehydrogenase [Ignavibacteriota bacterium]
MKIGFIGLGKMGLNMVHRLLNDKHQIVVYNKSKEPIKEAEKLGAVVANSVEELIGKLEGRKVIWLMVPSGKPVDENIDAILPHLKKDDIIIDGGNSYFKESQQRAKLCSQKGINYIDCGTSGGVWGLKEGYCLMYGGNKNAVDFCEPIFKTLAPENGYLYCGESGAGHFVKMVHNGIEYGMMQAYAEGFEILEKSEFNIDLKAVSNVWQYGSVVRSWLLELAHLALTDDPKLEKIKGFVQDSGEGRWTVQTAIDLGVPAHIITSSLFNRFQSRQDDSFAMKMLAALRNEFGGHAVKKN